MAPLLLVILCLHEQRSATSVKRTALRARNGQYSDEGTAAAIDLPSTAGSISQQVNR